MQLVQLLLRHLQLLPQRLRLLLPGRHVGLQGGHHLLQPGAVALQATAGEIQAHGPLLLLPQLSQQPLLRLLRLFKRSGRFVLRPGQLLPALRDLGAEQSDLAVLGGCFHLSFVCTSSFRVRAIPLLAQVILQGADGLLEPGDLRFIDSTGIPEALRLTGGQGGHLRLQIRQGLARRTQLCLESGVGLLFPCQTGLQRSHPTLSELRLVLRRGKLRDMLNRRAVHLVLQVRKGPFQGPPVLLAGLQLLAEIGHLLLFPLQLPSSALIINVLPLPALLLTPQAIHLTPQPLVRFFCCLDPVQQVRALLLHLHGHTAVTSHHLETPSRLQDHRPLRAQLVLDLLHALGQRRLLSPALV
mmetsp:Transcript_63110/g.169221  ORF Transcript_63110/g.169221 Transcript_63110/m.169221 type:complete len:356 (-) Transcript_63110:185-1252(-)